MEKSKLKWIYCSGCEKYIKTRGLCDKCDVEETILYMDNTDGLADAYDH